MPDLSKTFDCLQRNLLIEKLDIYGIIEASNSWYEKLLGFKVDHELNFNEHVLSLYKKATPKINTLSRIAYCKTFDQRRLILNSFNNITFLLLSDSKGVWKQKAKWKN